MDIGRKIKGKYDNPIDDFLLKNVIVYIDSVFYQLNFTPNMITTLSLICGILSAYCLYINSYLCIFFYLFAYILDMSDGYFARKHKMVTRFGDYYDHISDYTKHICIFYVMWTIDSTFFINQIFINLILLTLMTYHLSLQELIYDKKEESTILNTLNNYINFDVNNIHWAKYFGCPTYILYIAFLEYIYLKH